MRFASIGQLMFLIVFLFCKRQANKLATLPLFLIGIVGYLLLTAPISDDLPNILRGSFLLMTELTPYFLWLYAYSLVKDDFEFLELPIWQKSLGGVYLCWLTFFFGIQLGEGIFHQVSNIIALMLVLHVVYLVIRDWHDDLDDSRRRIRALLLSAIGLYTAVLASIQIIGSELKDSPTFGLLNALIVFLSVITAGSYAFRALSKPNGSENTEDKKTETLDSSLEKTASDEAHIPLIYQSSYKLLVQRMDDGYFKEQGLTISALATELNIPEHQLRELINKHLGFRNFSSFLNSYRLPAARENLADITKARIPILTIALDLGYGSIGPFNRAFKAEYNQTPREYRQTFLK